MLEFRPPSFRLDRDKGSVEVNQNFFRNAIAFSAKVGSLTRLHARNAFIIHGMDSTSVEEYMLSFFP